MKNIRIYLLIVSLFLSFASFLNAALIDPETGRRIVYMQPPQLESENIAQRIVCHRPKRKGALRIERERIGDKDVLHHYGEGSYGWTALGGAVDESVRQFTTVYGDAFETPITVVGAGCMGLATAMKLGHLGYQEVSILAESYEDLTSHRAGGILGPASNIPEREQKICFEAYRQYQQIRAGTHPYIHSKGVREIPAFFRAKEDSDLEEYVTAGLLPAAEEVLLDFKNGTRREMFRYDGIFMDTQTLMDDFRKHLSQTVPLYTGKITSFDEVETPVIFNCTGMGAAALCRDEEMVSVQGHLLMLKNQPLAPEGVLSVYDSMVMGDAEEEKRAGLPSVYRFPYILPKRALGANLGDVGVIGGTFIPGATAETPNEYEFDGMLARARRFYGLG